MNKNLYYMGSNSMILIMSKALSIIIPTYNGCEILVNCLESLVKQSFDNYEVFIIDNGSSDGTVEMVKTYYSDCRIIRFDQNKGFSIAMNVGIQATKTPYLLLLNNDTVLEPDVLLNLYNVLDKSSSDFAGVNPKVLLTDGRIDNIGIMMDRKWRAHQIGWNGNVVCPTEIIEIFGVNACASLFRKSFFDDVGFFDEDYFAYWEDVDIIIRGRLRNWRFLYAPDAQVHHMHSYTSNRIINFDKKELSFRNSIFTILKNAPLSSLFYLIIWHRIIKDIGNIIHYLKSVKGRKSFRAHIKAYLTVIFSLSNILKKRQLIQKRKLNSINGWLGQAFRPLETNTDK